MMMTVGWTGGGGGECTVVFLPWLVGFLNSIFNKLPDVLLLAYLATRERKDQPRTNCQCQLA